MDANAILCVVIGLIVIVARGPLIFAPEQTMLAYERMLATDARVRTVGLVVGALAIALLTAIDGSPTASFWLRALGWLLALAMIWLLVSPSTYRRLAQGVIGFAQDSTDTAIIRGIGLFAVVFGAWLVYVGIGRG